MNKAIVIGGGVIGLSTAYHLALKEFGEIVLLDKGEVGRGASSRAAGIITGLMWSRTGVEARKISLRRYREMSEELEAYRFREVGCLNMFDAEGWAEREKLLALYRELDVDYEVLDAGEMRRRWPDFNPGEEDIALFDPLGGYSEPDEYILALARKCRELGVHIREHQQVTGFVQRGGRICGVQTGDGPVEGDAVVNAVHVWTLKIFETLGRKLPLKAFAHQRYVTGELEREVRLPAINANPHGVYLRPADDRRLLIGVENEACAESRVPDLDFDMASVEVQAELAERAARLGLPLVPGIGKPDWEIEKMGLLLFSMDGEPVLGPVAELPGLYVACAFHSGGFAYNPAAGYLMAECVAEGRTGIDVSAFSPDRFASRDVDGYLETSVTHGEYAEMVGMFRH